MEWDSRAESTVGAAHTASVRRAVAIRLARWTVLIGQALPRGWAGGWAGRWIGGFAAALVGEGGDVCEDPAAIVASARRQVDLRVLLIKREDGVPGGLQITPVLSKYRVACLARMGHCGQWLLSKRAQLRKVRQRWGQDEP